MNPLPGAYFLKVMHPACAQNKTLISNTAFYTYQIGTTFTFRSNREGAKK